MFFVNQRTSAFYNNKRKVFDPVPFYYTSLRYNFFLISEYQTGYLLTPCSGYKGISANPVAKLLPEKSSSFPTGERIYSLKICLRRIQPTFSRIRNIRSVHRLRYGIKKKSEIMRSIAKNRKQGSNLPISIKLMVKIALVVLGFSLWGTGFVWALVGLYLFLPVIRGILSFFVGLGAIILFILILFSFL